MKIGIIGASLAGLIAGDKLAKAGHDVTVIEKDRALGGRLATHKVDRGFFDSGLPFMTAKSEEFKLFIDELEDKGLLFNWADQLSSFDGAQFHKKNPGYPGTRHLVSSTGLQSVAHYLKRWVDVKSNVKAGGMTFIGPDRSKKRSWMINLTDISVFECDAVIIATPAPQAYGILQTAQDETPTLRIIRHLDELYYNPRYVLMASYKEAAPDWKGIECTDKTLAWIGNETSKSEDQKQTNITIHSSGAFARSHAQKDPDEIKQLLLKRASEIANPWLSQPGNTSMRFWRYFEAAKTSKEYFMELEMDDAPLALIGDYFNGKSAEAAYLSGLYLAEYWINKYDTVSVTA